jgi:hypothetical protein
MPGGAVIGKSTARAYQKATAAPAAKTMTVNSMGAHAPHSRSEILEFMSLSFEIAH